MFDISVIASNSTDTQYNNTICQRRNTESPLYMYQNHLMPIQMHLLNAHYPKGPKPLDP